MPRDAHIYARLCLRRLRRLFTRCYAARMLPLIVIFVAAPRSLLPDAALPGAMSMLSIAYVLLV